MFIEAATVTELRVEPRFVLARYLHCRLYELYLLPVNVIHIILWDTQSGDVTVVRELSTPCNSSTDMHVRMVYQLSRGQGHIFLLPVLCYAFTTFLV